MRETCSLLICLSPRKARKTGRYQFLCLRVQMLFQGQSCDLSNTGHYKVANLPSDFRRQCHLSSLPGILTVNKHCCLRRRVFPMAGLMREASWSKKTSKDAEHVKGFDQSESQGCDLSFTWQMAPGLILLHWLSGAGSFCNQWKEREIPQHDSHELLQISAQHRTNCILQEQNLVFIQEQMLKSHMVWTVNREKLLVVSFGKKWWYY